MDGCLTPWDYCCEDQREVAKATIVIEALDAGGQKVKKADLGVRPLDLVAVRGTLTHEDDAVILRATSGWFLRERPEPGEGVRFP